MTVNACFDFVHVLPRGHRIPCSARIKNAASRVQRSCPWSAARDLTAQCLGCTTQSVGSLSCAVIPRNPGKPLVVAGRAARMSAVQRGPWLPMDVGLCWHQQGLYLTLFQGEPQNMALPFKSSPPKMAGFFVPTSIGNFAENGKQTLTRDVGRHRRSCPPVSLGSYLCISETKGNVGPWAIT